MVRMPKGKDFCRVESGVFASCPELCFVQLAQSLPFHELVRAGNVLCGRFYLDAGKGGELGRREPLTSKRRIEAFLRANPGIKGVKEARRALPWVTEGAASPPEAFLAMVFGLPYRYGGFQLSDLAVNRRLRPSHKAQQIARRTTLVPDILFADARLAIEYDSTAEHTSSSQLTRDAQKRLALEADGYKVVTVTAGADRRFGRNAAHCRAVLSPAGQKISSPKQGIREPASASVPHGLVARGLLSQRAASLGAFQENSFPSSE